MDIFTHAVLPYLVGSFFQLDRRHLFALVLGGIAPDLDLLLATASSPYPSQTAVSLLLVHRGITHSFFFGFFVALLVLILVSRGPVRAAMRRAVDLDLSLTTYALALAYIGVLCHLFLDFLTTRGVPLLFPWDAARFSANIYFHTEAAAIIASIAVLAKIYHDRGSRRSNTRIMVLFLAFLLLLGFARMEGKTTAESLFAHESVKIYPDFELFHWSVLQEDGDGFRVYEVDTLKREIQRSFALSRLLVQSGGGGLKEAIALAEGLPQVELFRWRAYAVAMNASFREGSWYLEYYDPVVKIETANASSMLQWVSRSYESLKVRVTGEDAEVIQ
jgi:inner membrane protein